MTSKHPQHMCESCLLLFPLPSLTPAHPAGLFAAVLVMALLGLGAAVVEDKSKDADEKDARLFLPIFPSTTTTGTGTLNPLLTLGGDSSVYVGLTIAGLTAAVIVLGILLAIAVGFGYKNNGSDFFGHSATP